MCLACGEVRAEALGHSFEKADCETPRICKTCQKTDGAALGHDWITATCETPKTCRTCDKTEGTAMGHSWLEATYTSPATCSYCGETRGSVLKVQFVGNWHMNGGAPTDTMEITQNGNEYSITIQSVDTLNGSMIKDNYTAYADGNYLYCYGDYISSWYIYEPSMGWYQKAASEKHQSYDFCYIENGTLYWNGNTAYSMY